MSERLPSRVTDFLFLGSLIDARNDARLMRNGFTHVLNVSESCRYADERPYGFRHVPLSDYGDSCLKDALTLCIEFIDQAKASQSGKILVHCRHGQNRSPTVVIGYLMTTAHISLREAYARVLRARPITLVHADYLSQLQALEEEILGKVSLQLRDLEELYREVLSPPVDT